MLNELRDLDFNDIGSASPSVRYIILTVLLCVILAIGYFLLVRQGRAAKVVEQKN
jgi:Tfp pilus assembly protein PilO